MLEEFTDGLCWSLDFVWEESDLESDQFAQDPIAGKRQSWDLNLSPSDCKTSTLLPNDKVFIQASYRLGNFLCHN